MRIGWGVAWLKVDYGVYWFGVCFREWYDTVVRGDYDMCEYPAWDFFNHINCNYPLEYRLHDRRGRG